jgi:hypothetical protein
MMRPRDTFTARNGYVRERTIRPRQGTFNGSGEYVIEHLDGNITTVVPEGIRRLYGVAPPYPLRGYWPETIADDLVNELEPTFEVDQILDRAYEFDSASEMWTMKPEVREMARYPEYQQAEDRMYRINAQQTTATSPAEMRTMLWSTPTFTEERTLYARETDSSTNQSDERVDAGTESDSDSPPIHEVDRTGTQRESAF